MISTPNKEIKLVAVYARVSTSNQENEGTIETQLAAIKEHAQKQHYTIVQDYLDNGWSGDNLMRPALDQLRVDAKKKLWDGVLIYDPDRLARRAAWQEVVTEELEEVGIPVLYVTISPPKSDEDVVMHKMRGVFAEYERMKIKERFRLGKVRKVKEGHVLTTEAPYGYRYVRNNKETKTHGYYVVNEEEARVVRMIFNWVGNDGYTVRKVVIELQKLGIKPRKSPRGVWSTSTLTTMLRHEAYIGRTHWGSSYAVVPEKPLKIQQYKKVKKTSRRLKPKDEWIASEIEVPKIVDDEVFSKTREQLRKNYALSKRNRKNEYLLSGMIRCTCGRTRSGEGAQKGKHIYYRCTDRVSSFPLPPTCTERGINARIADQLLWEKLEKLMTSPDLMERQIKRWKDGKQNQATSSMGDIKTLESEITKLKQQEDRYNKAYGAGLFSVEQLKSYTTPLREQVGSLEVQIAKAKQEENQIHDAAMPTDDDLKSFADESSQALPSLSFEQKRVIVTNTVRQIVSSQKELNVNGELKLDMLGCIPALYNHVEYKTIYRNCGLAKRREVYPF